MMKCLFCGKEFMQKIGKGRLRKYDTIECRRAYDLEVYHKGKVHVPADGTKGTSLHTCEKCGKEFFNYFQKTLFCSRKCFLERNFREGISGIIEKRCSACGKFKTCDTDNFHKGSRKVSSGLSSFCKQCVAKKNKTPQARKARRASRINRADKENQAAREYRRRPEVKKRRNVNETVQRKSDPSFALKNRIRVLMYHTIRYTKAGRKWQALVGYSIDDLRRHIEKQFKGGMSWERFMDGEIHVDHKIPVAAFNFSTPDDPDFKKCWAIKNLRPMWAVDNLKKSDRLDKPFQPSLTIGGSSL